METNKQKDYYTIESGTQLIRVSNLLITHIGVSLFFLLVVSVSLQSGNTSSLLVLNLFYVVFSLLVLGMGIYSLRMSGVNLIKSINPNFQSIDVYVETSTEQYSNTQPSVLIQHPSSDTPSNIGQNQSNTDGTFVKYRKDGKLHSKGLMKDGLRDGVYESYDEEGVLESITTYKNGIKEELFEKYFANGIVFERGIYMNNRLSGEYQIFTYDGSLKKTKQY